MRKSERALVAERLIAAMQQQNMNQSALSEAAGVPQSTISAFLNQRRSLGKRTRVQTHRTLRSLAQALGQQPTYFESTTRRTLSFPEAVRQRRKELGLALYDVAERVPMHPSYLSLWERGRLPVSRIKPEWQPRLEVLLGLSHSEMTLLPDDPDSPIDREDGHEQ